MSYLNCLHVRLIRVILKDQSMIYVAQSLKTRINMGKFTTVVVSLYIWFAVIIF